MNSTSDQTPDFQVRSSIPVVRMFDEMLTRSFYLDFLNYEIDWEHRFREAADSPLYMQIKQGESVLHLNGHATEESPTTEVRIPVQNLDRFCEYLCGKETKFEKPTIVDPRYTGRPTDMNIVDPSGNHLVFWSPDEDA